MYVAGAGEDVEMFLAALSARVLYSLASSMIQPHGCEVPELAGLSQGCCSLA
jgi:hypothetical protein